MESKVSAPTMHFAAPRGVHIRKIISQCLIVAIPMLASSLLIISIVYANLINQNCPFAELCPEPSALNVTSKDYYYIDFPAARLAIISSGSSTISFALVGFLMAIYAYTNAASLLRASEKADHESLPSPYQMSILLKVLNAEFMVLWDLTLAKLMRVFWKRERDNDSSSRSPSLLGNGVIVLFAGVIASIFVQAADVYFHVAAESVEFVQIQNRSSSTYQFSRGLAPWCLQRPTIGVMGQKNYFGCAITAQQAANSNATTLAPTNASIIHDMKNSVSDQHKTINFTDSSGVQYALIGPANVDTSMDWKASSFGVSTTCSAIPEGGCDVFEPIANTLDGQGNPVTLFPFNCTKSVAGIDIVGNLTNHNTATHMLNFHKYAAESPPFLGKTLIDLENFNTVLQRINSGEDANDILKNAWSALVMRKIPSAVQGDFSSLPPSFPNDVRVWKHNILGAFMLLRCNITVWDMTYTSIGSRITILNKSPSNGSTAGISSMPGTRFVGTLANVFQDESTGPISRSSPDNFIRSFEIGMSKAYSYPLASQLSSRPSLSAQARTSKVVTKLPVAALWFLVVTNVGYALLGVGLATWAMMKATEEVAQVQVRLGVAGFVAALFDREQFEEAASTDEGLFAEKNSKDASNVKKVAVMKTEGGGSSFALYW
ncbi:hypothetical protein BKA66DRAFT_590917 [Pyrenochaeta sp. MPI-SDFR-AT-0127]|nr:hypothetical protein BKA66DRAFT_590917 [Pyrenochaeta sp. MPI-SDFR-AT-0127]